MTEAQVRYEKAGKPTGEADDYVYQLEVDIGLPPEKVAQARAEKGWFVLATNKEGLSMADTLNTYKRQQRVERGVQVFKKPGLFNLGILCEKAGAPGGLADGNDLLFGGVQRDGA